MKRILRPEVWLLVGLLAVAWMGSHFLRQDAFVHLSERDRIAYGHRPVWQARFDALSATCGVGLLTYRLDEDYTPAGRWLLAGLGLAGAALYLAAARQAAARLWTQPDAHFPAAWVILVAFAAAQALVVIFVIVAEWLSSAPGSVGDSAWNAIAAFSSLGWLRQRPDAGHGWIYAVAALAGAVGWPVWLLVRRQRRSALPAPEPVAQPTDLPGPVTRLRGPLTGLCGYVAFLVLCAGLIAALEMPRGTRQGRAGSDDRLSGQPAPARFGRSLVQVVCASGAGIATEDTTERNVSEGTKLVLAGAVLVGALGGSVGGGIKWPLLIWTIAAGGALFSQGSWRIRDENARRCLLAGVAGVGAMAVLVLIVAFGLLLIESWTGSTYQTPPTLADGLLDASSAVAGADLTSGLTATVTSANLSSGIRQNVDLYQYGMAWLMAGMVIGRVLPVLVLGRCADLRFRDGAVRRPPLL